MTDQAGGRNDAKTVAPEITRYLLEPLSSPINRAQFGLVRVGVGLAAVVGPPIFPPGLAPFHRLLFAAYALLGGAVAFLALREIGDRWRPIVGGVVDVAVVTALVHAYGSVTTPLATLYLLPVVFNVMAHQKFLPRLLGGLGIASYLAIVVLEMTERIGYAPLRSDHTPPPPESLVGNAVFVSIVVFLVVLFAGRMMDRLRLDRARSDALIQNVLPAGIADRLKRAHSAIAEEYDNVTVVFADLVGFTQIAGRIPPGRLVEFLNSVFSTFDVIVEKHGLEKIKTIGDAYMAASGIPEARPDHADAAAMAALEMMAASREIRNPLGGEIALRIGVHSGPVVAGVIGRKKFSYDLWGDTVNVAARMESHGTPGSIQVSGATRLLLGERFDLSSQGSIQVKGKGELEAYLLIAKR